LPPIADVQDNYTAIGRERQATDRNIGATEEFQPIGSTTVTAVSSLSPVTPLFLGSYSSINSFHT